MNGEELVWQGGEHRFHLGIGELKALQKRCDAGPMWIFMRLSNGQWKIEDIVDTIRLGLIGGGMSEKDARDIVDEDVIKPCNYIELIPLVAQIITLSIMRSDEDDADEDDTEKKTQAGKKHPASKSSSKKSTPPEQPTVSPLDK